ncbi:MAG TPA: DUF4178 domain-containing protein [Kofleriaceae bacterium]|nr:DUF4178 domain-containing protein [Kofleriaceae bacterium]
MIWILLVVLTIVGGVAAVGVASRERKSLGSGSGGDPKALPAGGGDKLLERTVRDVRVDDVLTIDNKDFIVEGLVSYDEDGHRWSAARCADGTDVRWVFVGIERTGSSATRLMALDESTPMTGYPPEALVIGETRYALDKRGTATCTLRGDVGPLGGLTKDRPEGHTERCRWWLYNAPGDDTVIVEQWGSDYRVLRGKKVSESTIELMPGS